jgi:hypothetical protein
MPEKCFNYLIHTSPCGVFKKKINFMPRGDLLFIISDFLFYFQAHTVTHYSAPSLLPTRPDPMPTQLEWWTSLEGKWSDITDMTVF